MDNSIRNLSKLNKPFKYCVTTVVQQNNGAGFISSGNFINHIKKNY